MLITKALSLAMVASLLYVPAELLARSFQQKCEQHADAVHFRGNCYIAVDMEASPYPNEQMLLANQKKLCKHMAGYTSGWAVIPDKTVMDAIKMALPNGKTRYALHRLDYPAKAGPADSDTWHWLQSDGRQWPEHVADARMYMQVPGIMDATSGRLGGVWSRDRMTDIAAAWTDGWYVCMYRGGMHFVAEAAGAIGEESGDEAPYALEQRTGVRSVGDCGRLCYGTLLCQAFSHSAPAGHCRLHRLLAGDAHMPLQLVANSTYNYFEMQAVTV